jgi:hypothetical protein
MHVGYDAQVFQGRHSIQQHGSLQEVLAQASMAGFMPVVRYHEYGIHYPHNSDPALLQQAAGTAYYPEYPTPVPPYGISAKNSSDLALRTCDATLWLGRIVKYADGLPA